MSLQCQISPIPEVILVEPVVFKDDRGFFLETYHQTRYAEQGIRPAFVQDNHSHSRKGSVRGLHYQLKHPQGKLVYAVTGRIFDVVLDIRPSRGLSLSLGDRTGLSTAQSISRSGSFHRTPNSSPGV